jgi:hypothetical protein
VLASDDANADHSAFAALDISGGDMLTFSRPATDAQGRTDTATFKLAFAADIETADAFLFTCQRVNAPAIDRGPLERHANGATGIATVLAGEHASSFIRFVERAAGGTGPDTAHSLLFGNAVLRMVRPTDPAELADAGDTLVAIIFDIADFDATRAILKAGHVRHHTTDTDIVVPPAAGQGATFIFRRPS